MIERFLAGLVRVMKNPDKLTQLCEKARACRICHDAPFAGGPMVTEPRPLFRASGTARVCVASQAPGKRAFESGLTFNDASGDRLRLWMGLTRDEFYDTSRVAILPMGFCFPGLDAHGSDLAPRRECAPTWRARLLGLMPAIELIVCIGSYAQAWHLGPEREKSVDATVHDWRHILQLCRRPRVLPLPHPSWRNNTWLRRNLWFEEELLPVLQVEVRALLA
jgi:uracil-DNA glycosylase